jgi:HEAT repeat protein
VPGFITAGFLLAMVAAGAATGAALLVIVITRRAAETLVQRRQALADGTVRPLVLRAATSGEIPPALASARGRAGRAIERECFRSLERVRGDAHDALVEILQRRGAVSRAIGATSGRPPNVRAANAERLGLIAARPAVQRLSQLLHDDRSQRVRLVAARALGLTGAPDAAAALLGALDPGNSRSVPTGIIAAALVSLGADALPALRAAGRDAADPARRALAVDLLGILKDLGSREIVASNLRARDPRLRHCAVRSLGQLGIRQTAADLLPCLSDAEDARIRSAAAWALGRIRDPATATALSACLTDPDYLVAHCAATALAELGDSGARLLQQALTAGGQAAAVAGEALSKAARPAGSRPAAAQPPALSRPWYQEPVGRGLGL